MAVVFNADGLQKHVKSNLGHNLIYLHSARHTLLSLDIPNDFKYYTQLKNYPQNIDDIEKKVKNIEKWLDETIIHFKNAESNNAKAMSSLNTKSVGASAANTGISLVKGLAKFGEALVDTGALVLDTVATPFTAAYDGITYAKANLDGTEDKWESTTAKMWKGTMGFVAEDHVENVFSKFYKNTSVGQWLDKNAYEPFKSDGTACKITTEIGYITGVAFLTIATGGAGGAGTAATNIVTTGAGITTMTSAGRYTADYWAQMRDSSWEGIERFYKNGEISKEQYNSYKMIRSLDDEQWKAIEIDFQNGNISKEEYEQIKQIRELPEDWTTLENGLKGLAYGATNGFWEGIQWYVGGKLAGKVFSETSQLANSAIRVGADTGFNALDTPFRTTVDSVTSGKSWEQAWIEQGGWQSVLSNTGIGLVGSAGGEAIDVAKIKKGMNTLNNSNAFKNIDESTANKVKTAIMNDYASGKFDLSKISDTELATAVNNKITAFNVGNIDEAFQYVSSIDKNIIKDLYWFETADGRIIKPFSPEYKQATESGMKLIKCGNSTYFDIKNTLINKYNMSSSEASKYISNAMQNVKSNNISINTANINDIFEYCSTANGKYGVDQGILKDLYFWQAPDGTIILPTEISKYVNANITLKKVAHSEYFEVKNTLMTKYNMSSLDASKVLSALDSIGACTYASAANDIVGHFKDNPNFFKEIFGFPLYKKANNGNLKINAIDLLTDMYIFVNHTNNGGKLITTDINR